MNQNLKKALRQYGAIFEEAQSLIPATIGTDDQFGQVDVPGKENYVYVRIQSGEIAQAYNTKVVALAGLRVWCGYEKTRPGLLQVLDVRNVYGKEYQQRVPAHAKTHEYGGYDQVFIRGEQFIPKLVSKFSGMVVRVQAGAIYTDDFGWDWHNPQELNMSPYVPTSGAQWAMIEVTHSGTLMVSVGTNVGAKELLFATSLPSPHNAAQPLAAVAMYSNQSGINMSKYGNGDIFDLRWHQSIKTGTAGGGGGIEEAPIDGNAYGRKNSGWTIISGSAGMSEAPLDGLQYGRQSGSWTQISGTGGVGATAYSALTDVRISGTMTNGNTPVWIAASGAWYPMPTWEDSKDPTGFIDNDNISMVYDPNAKTIYLSGTLDYYWHGIKRTLGKTWTSPAHSGTAGLYYLRSTDGINFAWSTNAWTLDLLQVAYGVYITGSAVNYQFGVRECHGLMPWQVHEEFHQTISTYRVDGGAPIVGSYQLNSDNDLHTRPSFASAVVQDEDLESTIPSVTGTYTTLRITTGTYSTNFQTGEAFPFRATGSYILVNNPTTGVETAATSSRFVNIYQIMIPVTSDSASQKYRMVFIQPQKEYTSQALAEAEDTSALNLGNFASQFAESVFYTRMTYSTLAGYANTGKCRLVSLTYITRFGAGASAGGSATPIAPATYVLSGTNYNMPASVGTALEYARADHQHGTPPSGTGGGSTTTVANLDFKINQTSGTSVYPNLIGNQNSSNLYYTVSDRFYSSGKLLVFLNGQALSNGIDWNEQFPASGTFYFISGSHIPAFTDIITAQYTISGSLSIPDAPSDGVPYVRQSGAWAQSVGLKFTSGTTIMGTVGATQTAGTFTNVAVEIQFLVPMILQAVVWNMCQSGTYTLRIHSQFGGELLASKVFYAGTGTDATIGLDNEMLMMPGTYRFVMSGTGAKNWYRNISGTPQQDRSIRYPIAVTNVFEGSTFDGATASNLYTACRVKVRTQVYS